MNTEIKSKHGIVSKSPFELYMAFVDMRNFVQMLPEDKRQGVEADYDTITATIQGFKIGIMVRDRIPYSLIQFIDNGAPFSFGGSLHFDAVPDGSQKIKEALDRVVDGLVSVSEGRMPEGVDEETMRKMQEELAKRQGQV